MDLTIKRSKWLRGRLEGSMLLNRDRNMCCLGFYAKACGHTDNDIFGISEPAYVSSWKGHGDGCDSVYTELMNNNDDEILSEEERELKIASEFKSIGVNVTFED